MPIPDWNNDGLLPAASAPHHATLDEIYDRCVLDAPNRERREHLFTGLRLYSESARTILGPGALLISGAFVTQQAEAIGIVAVVIPDDYGAGRPTDDDLIARAHMLMTQTSVIVGAPTYVGLSDVKPFAGLLDALILYESHRSAVHRRLSRVTDTVGKTVENATKGYLEVRL